MQRSRMPFVLALCVVLLIVIACVSSVPRSDAAAADTIFFDDFSYAKTQEMKKTGWILRTEPGWPGVPGATWSEAGVSLHKHPSQPNN
jgi:hypothetical protein